MSRTLLAAGAATARARTLALMRSLGFYAWWPMDADRLTLAAGPVISAASDLIANRALTFAVGARPAYITSDPQKPCARFAGAECGKDAGGLLNGVDGATFVLIAKDATNTPYKRFVWYGVDGGTLSNGEHYLQTDVASRHILGSVLNKGAGSVNTRQTNAAFDATAHHVYVARGKFSDGTTAGKTIRKDGADEADASFAANDVSGISHGNWPVMVGASDSAFGANAYPWSGDMIDLAIGPYLSDADADRVQQALKTYRGTP